MTLQVLYLILLLVTGASDVYFWQTHNHAFATGVLAIIIVDLWLLMREWCIPQRITNLMHDWNVNERMELMLLEHDLTRCERDMNTIDDSLIQQHAVGNPIGYSHAAIELRELNHRHRETKDKIDRLRTKLGR